MTKQSESGDPSSLTLSIVQLDRSIERIDRPIADAAAHVLDLLSCHTPCSEQTEEAPVPLLDASSSRSSKQSSVVTTSRAEPIKSPLRPRPPPPPRSPLREKVETSITRYRRDRDRWTSFASLLLKSLAYYRSVGHPAVDVAAKTSSIVVDDDDLPAIVEELDIVKEGDIKETSSSSLLLLPIMDLPRTEYNRPYLPILGRKRNNNDHAPGSPVEDGSSDKYTGGEEEEEGAGVVRENLDSAMNVSHQYPWVCMAQHRLRAATEETSTRPRRQPMLLGVDVVVFEVGMGAYRPSVDEFLESFEGSFTPWEWERIHRCRFSSTSLFGRKKTHSRPRQSDGRSKLREFFLRWAMKEAYVKALGLGMNVDFRDFETRLRGVDVDVDDALEDEEEEEGIWSFVTKNSKEGDDAVAGRRRGRRLQRSLIGRVKHKKKSSTTTERWEFTFVPLSSWDNHERDACDESPHDACACICRGPLARKENSLAGLTEGNAAVETAAIEELTVADLIRFHGSDDPF